MRFYFLIQNKILKEKNMDFVKALEMEMNMTQTENGAAAFKSTGSDLVNLFGVIGALRTRDERSIEQEFLKAYSEDRLLALKMAFYARNVRGGLGERRTFRVILKELAKIAPQTVIKNLDLIPLFGRWDDLFVLLDSEEISSYVIALVGRQLAADLESDAPSLLGKWMPSENTSSRETRTLATKLRVKLGLNSVAYRKMLTKLRAKINVTEVLMSSKSWEDIQYGRVCSGTMTKCRNAFARNDGPRWVEYLEGLEKGTEKINASTSYPYDLFKAINFSSANSNPILDRAIEAQWKALPNYFEEGSNILIMADTSGSMQGLPFQVSVSLAVYAAERNKGPWHNRFITFSEKPQFHILKGDSLYERLRSINELNVSNTDMERAFNLILETAIANGLSQDQMPKALVIISDMEFDQARGGRWSSSSSVNHNSFFEKMVIKFAENGYEMPNIIFWNVEARQSTYQAFSDYKGVQLASGASPSVFKSLVANIGKSPYEAMLDVLSDPAYDVIKL